MFTTRKRMSGWKVLRLRWTSYTVTPSHRYSPGAISLVTSCERTMVTSLSPSLSPRIMNPLPPLSSQKAALTVETPLSSRRSSSTRMVSPRENVSIIASPSERPPPPRTHSSLPGEVWSIARPRASYSREPGSYNPTKFSEVWAVASRNSLYRILETSVALGTRQRAKSSSQAPIYVPGWGREGKLATVNFREFLFHVLGCIKGTRQD